MPTTLTEKMPITAMPRMMSSERMRSAATVAMRFLCRLPVSGVPRSDLHPIAEEAHVCFAQIRETHSKKAVAPDGAEPAHAAVLLCFRQISLEGFHVCDSDQVTTLILAKPPLCGSVVRVGLYVGTKAAGKRHLGQRHGNAAVRSEEHTSELQS